MSSSKVRSGLREVKSREVELGSEALASNRGGGSASQRHLKTALESTSELGIPYVRTRKLDVGRKLP